MRSPRRFVPTLLAAAVLAGLAAPSMAQPAEQPLRNDPCQPAATGDEARIDRMRRGVAGRVCGAARWFDGLFGDAREHADAYGSSYGRLGAALNWDELDDAQLQGRFRARLALPALGERFNAEIGRDDRETYVDDSYDGAAFLPGSFSDDRYAQWRAGVAFLARSAPRSVFDIGAGLELDTPLNPYVRARLRYFLAPAERVLVTLRGTGFWENDQGVGLTLGADTDWSLDDGLLLRFAQTATVAEVTAGARWRSRLSLYQALDARSALRYEASIQGQTDGVQPDYRGLRLTYRRSVWREWLFLELSARFFSADDPDPARRCSRCVGASVGFEMMFGDKYDRWLARTASDGAVDESAP